MSVIGIDFGTTNSVVAHWNGQAPETLSIDSPLGRWETLGFDKVMPSVHARTDDGRALFGWEAKRHDRNRFEAVKRLFATQQDHVADDDGGLFAVEEVATLLFRQLRSAAAAAGVGADRAVVTIPANSRGLARHRTKICAGMAGMEVLALINEPTAAALSWAQRSNGDGQVLVFDWGGGTLDVTVLRSVSGVFMEQASKGLPTCGGIDFDSKLHRLVMESVTDATRWTTAEKSELRLQVELAKVTLSEHDSAVIPLPGGDVRTVTRKAYEAAIRPLVEHARQPIEQCLADIGAMGGAIDAVVMVGGTSRTPCVREFISEITGIAPASDIDPMTAVAEGAAVAAGILTGEITDNDFFVATEHALGLEVQDTATGRMVFGELIPRNHKLPAKRTKTYWPVEEDQESVRIQVVEGDPSLPLDDELNVLLQEWLIPLGEEGDQAFDVTYSYDVNGILHVRVVDEASGTVMMEESISYGITADPLEMVRMARSAAAVVETGVVAPPSTTAGDVDLPADVLKLLESTRVRVLPFLDDHEVETITSLVADVVQADPDDVADRADALKAALRSWSYLL